jgi:hypothetical protein
MRTLLLAMIAILLSVGTARAQVIQLPSFHQFSVDTTVVVPDSGRASIAGNRSGRAGRSNFNGLPPNRAAGVDRGAGGASVHAQIHDPAARERELALRAKQGGTTAGKQAAVSAKQRKMASTGGSRAGSRTPAVDAPLPGVAEIRRMQASRSVRTATKSKK